MDRGGGEDGQDRLAVSFGVTFRTFRLDRRQSHRRPLAWHQRPKSLRSIWVTTRELSMLER
jgi:hypothetical protein